MAFFSVMQDRNGEKPKPKPKPKEVKKTSEPVKKKGIVFYKGGIEKTPTGKSNAYIENIDKMSADDIMKYAKELNIRTDNVENMQEDMYNLLADKYPQKLKEIMSTYGNTKAGTRIYKGKEVPASDKYFGARSTLAMKQLMTKPKDSTEIKTKTFEYSDKPRGESLYDKKGALIGNFDYKVTNEPQKPYETFTFSSGIGTSGNNQLSGTFEVPNEEIRRFRNLIQLGASKYPNNPSTMSLEELEKYRVKK